MAKEKSTHTANDMDYLKDDHEFLKKLVVGIGEVAEITVFLSVSSAIGSKKELSPLYKKMILPPDVLIICK